MNAAPFFPVFSLHLCTISSQKRPRSLSSPSSCHFFVEKVCSTVAKKRQGREISPFIQGVYVVDSNYNSQNTKSCNSSGNFSFSV